MSPYSDISVEALASGAQLIRLNRPEVRNALRTSMLGEIAAALEAAEQDESLRCVLLTGNEQAFAAGADVREMAELDAVGLFKDQ
jgi:enoyl-CoA hydratase